MRSRNTVHPVYRPSPALRRGEPFDEAIEAADLGTWHAAAIGEDILPGYLRQQAALFRELLGDRPVQGVRG